MDQSFKDKAMNYIHQNTIVFISFTMPSLIFLYLLTEIKFFLYLLAPVSILWIISCIYNDIRTKKGIIINAILLIILLGYKVVVGKSIYSNPILLVALLIILIAINLYDIVKK